jgi:oligopeptide/dipeptide ABC transporter ATP-binding protein
MMSENLLEITDLKVHYPKFKGLLRTLDYHVKAVDGVSLTVKKGAVLGLVGESGCGKTTAAKAVIGLVPVTGGRILFKGADITHPAPDGRLRNAREIQIIFQDPYASLNPKMRIAAVIDEAVRVRHPEWTGDATSRRTAELLAMVGLHASDGEKYSHEFSGGQRQRIGIARAIAVEPELIICDEPVSALDVSVQAGIINLLMDLKQKNGLTYVFIAHDLSVVRYISDEVAIMYLGQIAETGPRDGIFAAPLHPYTVSLLSAVPEVRRGEAKQRIILEGDVPSPVHRPPGCSFHPRCPRRFDPCDKRVPALKEIRPGHWAACHLF